ncbi:MAG: hypothetical protein RR448_12250 [Niameybacter sp.]|uniref:hypothetical protein n=1 Tax=Niameybacter sp. TaxID=2033640 RepID=UPI002FCB7A1D
MRETLGPIHYWLYHKIQLQEQLIEELLRWGNEKRAEVIELRIESHKLYGKPAEGKLETCVQGKDIHRWLQEKLDSVEYRLAYIFTLLLDDKYITMEETQAIFRENGLNTAKSMHICKAQDKPMDARELYKRIYDCLLEGMPCDDVNEIIVSTVDEVVWKRTKCIHEKYWKQVGGDIIYFYVFRQAWVEGFLQDSGMKYEELQRHIYAIKK